ncbi:MAG TPA: ABC transporter ATP-binding protein [Symbiobacteriaceae bacterium]
MSAPDTVIELVDVEKSFLTSAGPFQALRSVNLEVRRSEFVAVVGRSGSGKSTMLNVITGIDRPTAGEVTVGGRRLAMLSESQLARWRGTQVGIVFQFFHLIPTLTVQQNVMLPMDFCGAIPRRDRRARVMQLLEMVGLSSHAHKRPSQLSGGQQQRTAIARALANDPPIIVGDELTGNLDSTTGAEVFQILKGLAREGKTVVIVTHDLELAGQAGRVVTMQDGAVVPGGRPA